MAPELGYDPAGSFGGALNDLGVKRDQRREESREAIQAHREDRDDAAVEDHELRDKGYYSAINEAMGQLRALDRLETVDGKLSEPERKRRIRAIFARLREDEIDTGRSIREVPLDNEDLRIAEGRVQGLNDALEILSDYWSDWEE